MKPLLVVALLGTAILPAPARNIIWTAQGTVSSVAGSDFTSIGVAASDPVAIRFSYNDRGVKNVPGPFDIFGIGQHFQYAVEVDLEVRITINEGTVNELTWEGSLGTGNPGSIVISPPSVARAPIEIINWDIGPGQIDEIRVRLATADDAVFTSFPGQQIDPANIITLNLGDEGLDEEGSAFLFDASLACAHANFGGATQGSGRIGPDAANGISFTIDPASVLALEEPLPLVEGFTVERDAMTGEITLKWQGDSSKTYEIQSSPAMTCWFFLNALPGSDGEMSFPFFPIGSPDVEYYRILEFD